jgi:hypothetical protein
MKNKTNIYIAMTLILIVVSIASVSLFYTKSNIHKSGSSAVWAHQYDDVKTLIENSDLIISGKVVESVPELRYDMVFTKQYISVDSCKKGSVAKGEIIEVSQTGGEIGTKKTEPFDVAPLFKNGEEYMLFLHKAPEGYYLEMGGYQGTGKISNGKISYKFEEDKINKQLKGRNIKEIDELVSKSK